MGLPLLEIERYTSCMSEAPSGVPSVRVGVRELRDHLSSWLERVKDGEEIVITERGKPIARIRRASGWERLDELIALGVVTPAREPRMSLDDLPRISMTPGPPIEDIVAENR